MTQAQERQTQIERASTLELFLDLVFVFTVTQLTELVAHPHGAADYLHATLVLGVTWWMYDGYIWLTGNVRSDRAPTRLALFTGMGGFLLMALAIPAAFGPSEEAAGDSGVVFGIAFLVVTAVHLLLFSKAPNSSAQAIWRIAPFNLGCAALVLLAGVVDDDWRWVLWLVALIVVMSTMLLRREQGFSVSSAHFAERHGLVIIIALGESIVAIGVGASGLELDGGLVVTALLGLALSASLWWIYFDEDDSIAEAVIEATAEERRTRLALVVGLVHVAMIAGIVLVAAGIKSIVEHPTDPAETAAAWNLAAGLLVYLIGESLFRRDLGVSRSPVPTVAGAVALATVPLGLAVSGVVQLAAVVALVVGVIVVERR